MRVFYLPETTSDFLIKMSFYCNYFIILSRTNVLEETGAEKIDNLMIFPEHPNALRQNRTKLHCAYTDIATSSIPLNLRLQRLHIA